MSHTHETTPQADAPPVMVAIGADLIREAVECLRIGLDHARGQLCEHDLAFGRTMPANNRTARAIESDIARMEEAAKALAEALPGGAA